jgi:2-octaprenyl-6-methoxyphenol hydroxylase
MRQKTDIFIAGGGYVGLACALGFAQKGFKVALCDPRLAASTQDKRAFLMACAARRFLETLGVWAAIAPEANLVEKLVITDSKLNDTVRPTLLAFAGEVAEGEPFGHMVEQGALMTALLEKAKSQGVILLETAFSSLENRLVKLKNGQEFETTLLIGADGAHSMVRQAAKIGVVGFDYDQVAIVATLAHEKPHENTAFEHFLPAGPFATLPLKDNRSSLVWTEDKKRGENLLKLPSILLQDELQTRFAFALGAVTLLDRPRLFKLSVQMARKFTAPRVALIGDAAHVIHPIAGQGVNLGLQDVVALMNCVESQAKLGLDYGQELALRAYQQERYAASLLMAGTTDGLNRLFSQENMLLRLARDVGLGLVERLPRLKNAFIRRAAGV